MKDTDNSNLKDIMPITQPRYDELNSRVSRLESDMTNLIKSVDSLSNYINQLGRDLNSKRETKWDSMAAWGTLILAIVCGVGYLSISPIQEELRSQKKYLTSLDSGVVEHWRDGHPHRVEDKVLRVDGALNEFKDETRQSIKELNNKIDLANKYIYSDHTKIEALEKYVDKVK